MSGPLVCGCTIQSPACDRPATQEDILCDPCRSALKPDKGHLVMNSPDGKPMHMVIYDVRWAVLT